MGLLHEEVDSLGLRAGDAFHLSFAGATGVCNWSMQLEDASTVQEAVKLCSSSCGGVIVLVGEIYLMLNSELLYLYS